MAYRIGKDVTFRQMYTDVYKFLREMTSISEVDYQSAGGNGALFELSVPAATSTTETWTLVCADATYPARFTVEGNLSGNMPDAHTDTLYNNGIIKFTIKDGTQPWVLGDIVTFSTRSAVHTPWSPRTISPLGNVENPPYFVKGVKQKAPQYGSDWLAPQRNNAYLIPGPKVGSSGLRPVQKSRAETWQVDWQNQGTGAITNEFVIGGPYTSMVLPVESDGLAPTNFTVQLWVANPVYAMQSNYGPTYGEALYAVHDLYGHGSTMSISIFDSTLRVGARYQTNYIPTPRWDYNDSLWYADFDLENYLVSSGKASTDWFLITASIDKATNTVTVYIDKEYLGEYNHSDVGRTHPALGGIGSFCDVAGPVIWHSTLTQTQVNAIYDSPTITPTGVSEIFDAFTWDETTSLPYIDMENKDSEGNLITIQMAPQNYPYYSYRYDSRRQTAVIRDTQDPELQHMNSTVLGEANQWNSKGTYARVYSLGAHPVNTIVDKYWVVATTEYVCLVYKIFDQSTPQQLPVYQTVYLGRGDSLQDKLYTVVLGTRDTGNDYWYTGNANFRSGVYYQYTCNWFGQYRWQVPTRIGAPSKRGQYKKSGNSYNVWSVFHSSDYHTDTPDGRDVRYRIWDWPDLTSYYEKGLTPERMGTFFGLYGIQANDTTPEDIVIIDGIEHLAYTDCTQSGENSMLLLRLE